MRTITSILSFLSLSFSRCIFTIILLTPGLVFALKESPKELSRPNQGFIENKGQIIDQNHKPNPAVLYLLNMPGMNVQLRRGGFSYDIYRISNIDKHTQNNELNHHGNTAPLHHGIKDSIPQPPSSIIDFHRIDLDLVGINSDYTIESGGATSDYTNYYLGFTPREGIQNVRSFKKIIYRNIYPNIDLDFSADDKHIFKYTFIIHPGARLCDIQILVSEPSILQLEKDTLVFHTTLGDITENIPECFMTEKDSIISIKGFFRQITSNIYGFSTDLVVPDGATLVLDPSAVRLWGTYYGGPAVEYTANSTVDGLGNSFITGSTWSDINIATAGAYQTARASLALSGFIVKFNPAGVRQWGTYYGSTKGESIYGSAGDNLGNIYVVGVTMSDTGMATPGAHQDSCGCSINSTMDAFIAKFSPNGWRIWGTYYGWEGTDYIFSVAPDNYGNVFVVGQTSSSQNIATPGSYRDTYEGYNSSFLVKFDTSGVRLWGSYYTGNDLRYCAVDADGNLYATGSTGSDTAVASPGAYQTTKGGEYDAFLIAFSTTGERLWSTYYGGSLDDYGESCNVDSANNIYIAGYTESPDGIASPGSHQETFGGLWDGFIAKFNSSGQRLWGSYYGGAGSDVIHSCSGGSFGDIFFSGETNSINNISTANSFMPDYAGAGDAYLVKFNINGERQWGTYFGGTGWDQNSTCSYIAEDTIYLGGQTMSTSNISTPNGHQPVIGGQKDAYLIKFIDCRPISMAQPIIGPADICKNTTGVNYSTSSLAHAVNYVWNLPPGATLTSGAGTTNITVDFSSSANSGYISVKGLNKCGDAGDSASLYINLHARPVPVISGEVNPCTGPQYIYSTESGKSNYQWSLSPGGNITAGGSVADNTVTIVWISGGPQWIRVNYTDTNNCNALVPTQLSVSVTPGPTVDVTISASSNNVCEGTVVTFTANPVNPGSFPVYQWKVNGSNVGINSSVYIYTPLNNDVILCVLTSDLTCSLNNPATSNTITMVVNPANPVSVTITPSANPVCSGVSVTFTATPQNEGSTPTYQWQVNGINAGTNSSVFTYIPINNDIVTSILTSSETVCVTNNPATSNLITMTVNPNLPVSVSIAPSANPVCAGTSVTFTATPVNGGVLPTYQWQVNGINTGANNPVYSYVPVNNDVVTCILTSSETICVSNNPATSNSITMMVDPNMPVSISITASANPVCSGTSMTFTATPVNEGTTPSYQWKVNGINSGLDNPLFVYPPVNNDVITCVLTSSETVCVTNNPATSNTITMIVNPTLPVSVSISPSANPVCSGTSVTFTATAVNGGTLPVYQWTVNGAPVGTNSPAYTYAPASGDLVSCILTSNATCAIGNPATSNTITMTVASAPVVSFTACFDTITTVNAKPIKLRGGIPLGGSYTGAGVSAGIFYPAIAGPGIYVITYTYTNAASCISSDNLSLHVLSPPPFTCGSLLVDIRDSKSYPTVQLGGQCWMASNLNYGSQIAGSIDQRDNCIVEKYCYNDLTADCGRQTFYQWDELMQYDDTPGLQGLCPPAWHLPTEAEWNTLFSIYINNAFAGSPLKYSGYSGFNALLSGVRLFNKSWSYDGFATFFWSSTSWGPTKAWAHAMNDMDPSVALYPSYRTNAFSVRCVKD